MQIKRRNEQNFEVVSLEGTLDASVAAKVRDELKSIVDSGRNQVVVDLTGVKFIDSSGLSALVTGFKAARAVGGDVALCGLTAPVRSIIELTRLHRIMDIYDDVDAAVAKMTV